MTTQPYFQELTNVDTRRRIYEEKIKKLEEDLMPFGFIESDILDDASQSSIELARESSDDSEFKSKSKGSLVDMDEIL
jgi:hypothetical protein